LAVAAIMVAGPISDAMEAYKTAAFSNGFVNGYLTMDTLGAMVFGIVIVNAARFRGDRSASADPLHRLGWPDGRCGLTLLYLALFRLGSDSAMLVDQSPTARRSCMLTCSTPSAVRAASCWRR
jgi:LIVCS family branched-chain amino acid:cation transporter